MAADASAPRAAAPSTARATVAVIGGGWAGIAAAVDLCSAGAEVVLYDMARHLGGRARSINIDGDVLDNGQHILVGAYVETLALMRRVGADPDALLCRSPLSLIDPAGAGLRLPPGPPMLAFARGVLAQRGWPWSQRLALLREAGRWLAAGFECDAALDVAMLCRRLPRGPWRDVVEPLCVAALNTPAERASARVFLRVLRDALFSGRGSADLLLPRAPLGALLPEPAAVWLQHHGTALRLGRRVQRLEAHGMQRWAIDGEPYDAVVLACPPDEAARLAQPHAPAWSAVAGGFRHEPIATVVLDVPGARLRAPMLVLPADQARTAGPAQFVFDQGLLSGRDGRLVFVISAAAASVDAGREATVAAVRAQARGLLQGCAAAAAVERAASRVLVERRATFACVPGLQRPAARVALGLHAAGDHVEGPYPATLEGAVRSGRSAARAALLDARVDREALHVAVGVPRYG